MADREDDNDKFYKTTDSKTGVYLVRKDSRRGKEAMSIAEKASTKTTSKDVKERVAARIGVAQAVGDAKFFKHSEKDLK